MIVEDVELHHRENYVEIDVAMQNHPPASIIQDFDQVKFTLKFTHFSFADLIKSSWSICIVLLNVTGKKQGLL